MILRDVNFRGADLTRLKYDNATIEQIAEGSTNGDINLEGAILGDDLKNDLIKRKAIGTK
jgi:hypothetical protein